MELIGDRCNVRNASHRATCNRDGARMRVVPKDLIRFAVRPDESFDPAVLEVRVEPDRFGGWQTRTTMVPSGGVGRIELPRVFRAKDRHLALGKMVTWIRGRYRHVQPVAVRQARPGRSTEHQGSG